MSRDTKTAPPGASAVALRTMSVRRCLRRVNSRCDRRRRGSPWRIRNRSFWSAGRSVTAPARRPAPAASAPRRPAAAAGRWPGRPAVGRQLQHHPLEVWRTALVRHHLGQAQRAAEPGPRPVRGRRRGPSLASTGGNSMGATAGEPLEAGTALSTIVSKAWRGGPSLVQTDPSGRPRTDPAAAPVPGPTRMRSSNTSTLSTTTPASRNRLGTLASRIAPPATPGLRRPQPRPQRQRMQGLDRPHPGFLHHQPAATPPSSPHDGHLTRQRVRPPTPTPAGRGQPQRRHGDHDRGGLNQPANPPTGRSP